MSKADDVLFLVEEARRDTGTKRRMRRTQVALDNLGLGHRDVRRVMTYLDYWDENGTPYPKYREEEEA